MQGNYKIRSVDCLYQQCFPEKRFDNQLLKIAAENSQWKPAVKKSPRLIHTKEGIAEDPISA